MSYFVFVLNFCQDEMKKEVNKVRMVVSVHHRILSDMRMILKTMRKVS